MEGLDSVVSVPVDLVHDSLPGKSDRSKERPFVESEGTKDGDGPETQPLTPFSHSKPQTLGTKLRMEVTNDPLTLGE